MNKKKIISFEHHTYKHNTNLKLKILFWEEMTWMKSTIKK
jgi:hypothetical protein